MAFKNHGFACWAVGLVTALAARTADAQAYNQPAASPAPQYSRPPAAYQPSPNQPATNPQYQYQNQPAATYPQYQSQPNSYPQYPNQPAAYANQPARQPTLPPSAPANRYQGVRSQSPSGATYPEAYRSAGAARGGVRPAQFEQPIDGQPAAPPAPQGVNPQLPAGPGDPPGFRATEVSASASALPSTLPADVSAGQAPQEHPLMPALRWAKQGLADINKIQDYSCTLVKRERIDGTLGDYEYIFVKVRHQPFSVYTYFLGPPRVKGQEAIYVDGQNSNNLLAHGNGIKHRLIGTVSLKPTSPLAMSGNRYPITEMGMRRLLERLLEIGTNDVKYGECSVKWIQNAKINQRTCTCIEVQHPVPRRNFLFHLARIYVDDEMQLPIRYEAFDWPARQGEQPPLNEEYTFLNVKVNNGFTDADFGTDNATYGFK